MTSILSKVAAVLILLVALQHLGFLTLQMFLWEHEIGRGVFNTTPETAAISATLAKQQGLYNGFLAAGLIWGLITRSNSFIVFFLLCVVAAGVFGAATVSTRILLVQALPAAIALAAYLLSRKSA